MSFWPAQCDSALRPLKHVCVVNPETLPESTDPDFEFEYIDIGNVSLESGISAREPMTFAKSPSRARKPVRPGDVIVSTVRTYLKAVASIGSEADNWIVSTGFAVLRSNCKIDPRFLYRVVQSNPFVEGVVAVSTGVSYPAINPSTLGSIPVPLPDLETQKAIADFLDRETARIDQLIEKKEMLLRLLAERLDIKVKELLSKRHAEEMKLGHCLQLLFDGVHVTPTYVDDGVPFLRVTDITSSGPINWGRVKRISHDEFREITRRRSAKRGDLLLSKNGTVGVPKVVTWDDDFAFFVSLAVLRPSRRVTSEYLEVLFRSSLVREQISDQSRQTSVINLHLERIRNLKIPVPPLSEQESIVSRVKQLSQPIDALVARIQNSVVRLGEFRSALITAAVTGQIDMATWGKRSFTDRRLDQIEEAMRA